MKRASDGDDIESLMDRLDEDPFRLPTTPEAGRANDDAERVD